MQVSTAVGNSAGAPIHTPPCAAKADPNARDNEGATPLHMAAYASRPVNVQLLLEAGADPLAKTDNGRDPGSMARKVKADETAGVLSLWILKGCKAGKPC